MEKKIFAESELIINADGSAFHLHLKPEQLADNVILVGDPARVGLVASHFSRKECEVQNREFHTITGWYGDKRVTVQSTGIGCDNIDIVLNELDALANIDFATRTERTSKRSLTLVRIGTCGGLQPFTPTGTYVATVKSIGFDGLLNYYGNRERVVDQECENAFRRHMQWSELKGAPYVVNNSQELLDRIASTDMVRGITIACGGFYGPQGRQLRIPLQDPEQNEKVESFEYGGLKVTNFEMESSALAGLSAHLGHKSLTVCMVIANRWAKKMNTEYKNSIDDLILKVLERI